jgi:hypothetical protein
VLADWSASTFPFRDQQPLFSGVSFYRILLMAARSAQ